MDVRVLGSFEVCAGGRRLSLGGPKQRAVVANLVAADSGLSMDRLITEIYGADGSPSAKRSIHTYISNIRQELGGIVREGGVYRLPRDAIHIDARAFESTYREGAAILEDDPRRAARLLRDALEMWRGRPYAGVAGGPLVEGETARLNELRLVALQSRIDADLALGMHADLVGELEALVTEYPFVERFHAQRMLALYRSGRQREALRAYRRLEGFLAEELGIEPSHAVRDLEEAILLQAPALDLDVHPLVERRAILAAELPEHLLKASPAERDRVLALRNAELDAELRRLGGEIIGIRGTAVYASFVDVSDAVDVARTVASGDMNVAIDFGEVDVRNGEITGPPMSRSARLVAAAHPGQVLLSEQAQIALSSAGAAGWSVKSLGRHRFAGVAEPLVVFQGLIGGIEQSFPPLNLDRLPPPVPAGHRSVAGYEVRKRLAVHAHSIEYSAYHHALGREVGLRVFEAPLVSKQDFVRRFEAELQRVARLDHPNILPILDFWRDPQQAVVVSRLATRGPLDRALPDGTDVATMTSIVTAIGFGIAHAHDAGVLHGAVTPSEVVLDADDHPYVSGLGVAHVTDGLLADRHDAFAPPDRELTVATDVFGLGKLAEWLLRKEAEEGRAAGPVVAVIDRAIDPDPSRRHLGVRELIDDLMQASGGPVTPLERTDRRNPYKSLEAFDEADTGDFFGRNDLTDTIVRKVATGSLTLVVGPSGVGKSSVVRAGLVPALRRGVIEGSERWLITHMVPGAHPFDELVTALARIAPSHPEALVEELRNGDTDLAGVIGTLLPGEVVLLIVDQLEEVFTQTVDDAERQTFLDVLSEAASTPRSVISVVAALRVDFFDRPLMDPAFGGALQDRVVNVHALDVAGLAEVVREPALGVGIEVDEDLVWAMAHDAAEGPGGLPLLQYALAGVFETRRADRMTADDYARMGGLRGSIAKRADDVYAALSPEAQELSRAVFTELVSVAPGVEDTRRRVALRDLLRLERSSGSVDEVLDSFAAERLLTFDRDATSRSPTVELAHEAVLGHWDRLRSWIDEVRDDLLTSRRVDQAWREWEESGRDPSFLLGGARLEQIERWAARSDPPPGAMCDDFLRRSRAAQDLADHHRRRLRRLVIAALTAGLVVVSSLGIVAAVQGRDAERRALENRVAELASEAQRATEEDPDLAINLALAAYDVSAQLGVVPPSVTQALQATLLGSRLERVIQHGALVVSSDGRTVAIVDDPSRASLLRLFDLGSGEQMTSRHFRFEIGSVAYHPTAPLIAVAPEEGYGNVPAVVMVDAITLETVDEIGDGAGAYGLSFSDDGTLLAGVDRAGTLRIWDTAGSTAETRIPMPPAVDIYGGAVGGAFIPGSSTLAVVAGDVVLLVEARTGRELERLELLDDGYSHLAAHPDGDTLALSNRTGTRVDLISMSTGAVQSLGGFVSPMDLAISSDGATMVVGGTASTATAVDLRTLERMPLPGHGGGAMAVAAAGDRLLVQSLDRGLHIWRADGPVPGSGSLRLDQGELWLTAFSADGARAASMTLPPDPNTGSVSLVDKASGRVVHRHEFTSFPWAWPLISEDGELAVGLNIDTGVAEVVEMRTGTVELSLRPCELPRGISHGANLVAVAGDCTFHPDGADPDRPPRTGVLDLTSGDLILDLSLVPGVGFITVGTPGTPAEDLVLVAAPEAKLEVWRLSTRQRLSSWRASDATPLDGILPLKFFVDGSAIVLGEQNGRLAVFDTEMIQVGASLHEALRFSIQGHSGALGFVDGYGDYVVTSSSQVRLRDAHTGELLVEVTGRNRTGVAMDFDGSAFYYDAGHGLLQRVPLTADELAAQARLRVTRGFNEDECIRFFEPDECPASGE